MTIRFDWLQFCRQNHIHYVTEGPNTKSGELSIKCPFCGNADPSEHMGLSLLQNNPVWGCLRNGKHRGKHPAFLVAQLLGISFTAAKSIIESAAPPLDGFDAAIAALRASAEPVVSRETMPVVLDPQFKRLAEDGHPDAHSYRHYLGGRGFSGLIEMLDYYELYYARFGEQAYRIIFPVWKIWEQNPEAVKLVGWTGRDITGQSPARYKAMHGMDKDAVLFFPPSIESSNALIIVEGPFDALKMDFYGRDYGMAAVAIMGTGIGPDKLQALYRLRQRYDGCYVMLDSDAYGKGMSLAAELDAKHCALQGVKDPGDMTEEQARRFYEGINSA